MLSQLMGSGVGEITAVVVRYYGGILLGTGGLVKPTAEECSRRLICCRRSAKRHLPNILCCVITLSYLASKRCLKTLTA